VCELPECIYITDEGSTFVGQKMTWNPETEQYEGLTGDTVTITNIYEFGSWSIYEFGFFASVGPMTECDPRGPYYYMSPVPLYYVDGPCPEE